MGTEYYGKFLRKVKTLNMSLIPTVGQNRVFVLGSGFSASMGLPTLADLFKNLMDFPEREGEEDKLNIFTALDFLYPHFDYRITPPSYPPFEEFLALVTAAEDFPFFLTGTWECWRRSAIRLLTDFLAEKSKCAETNDLLHDFVSHIEKGDVVITYNWDTLIERALLSQHKNINFLKRDPDSIAILKLHGSLSWVEIPEGTSLKHPESVKSLQDRVVYTPDYTYYNVWDTLNLPPLIVPPGLSRRSIVNQLFKNVWGEAFQSLANCDSLTFIGYSIPKDDIQARSLLSIGWYSRSQNRSKDRIKYNLIDPNPEVLGRYASCISNELIYIQSYFDDNVLNILFNG